MVVKITNNLPAVDDVAALSRQTRGLHSATEVSNRQKYHKLKLGRQFKDQLHARQDMLLEMLVNPSLAGYLHHLVIYGSDMSPGAWGSSSEPIPQRSFSPEDINRLKQAIEKADIQETQDRESMLSTILQDPTQFRSNLELESVEFTDVLVTLLVANAPNLQSLSMFPLHGAKNRLMALLRRASNAPSLVPYCQNLRDIHFHPDESMNEGTEYVADPYYHRLNLVRKLPAIESVSFKLAAWDNDAGFPLPPRCANYSKISITHSFLLDYDLCRIIESPKTLKSFTFTVGGRKDPDGVPSTFNATPLLKSLWSHRQTLEELDIDIESHVDRRELYDPTFRLMESEGIPEDDQGDYEEEYADDLRELASQDLETLPSYISLKDFPRLKRLSIGAHTLCYFAQGVGFGENRFENGRIGPEAFNLAGNLPPNLKSLRVYGRGEEAEYKCFEYESDLDVDAQLDRLICENNARSLEILEGIDVPIPNGKTVDNSADDDDRSLYWNDPDDDSYSGWDMDREIIAAMNWGEGQDKQKVGL
ncbi:uncharacterized protein N7479_007700 [Penicillium vulpinum]|uniref:Uncharacterized protein n=1 Tax=Penicillium vulpinum TaxID=29845 RepID=A0A1V6SAQ6_9EURO|nr:uncharacterized protein N7479_007700 [Penicillium vulpinum]KAJ5960550.1 hypothetical protein N7479_007700 [Penicillium vulpinum]OQE11132.1 hypothetical protein PENVUL_c003G02391 [Penicillium vulpinum]